MSKYAVIKADLNSSALGDIISIHRTESAAEKAADNIGGRGIYVAHRKPDGQWERRLEARDRRERPKGGRPTLGAERKKVYTVMIEPAVADRLRKLGGDNLSRGIALAAEKAR